MEPCAIPQQLLNFYEPNKVLEGRGAEREKMRVLGGKHREERRTKQNNSVEQKRIKMQ